MEQTPQRAGRGRRSVTTKDVQKLVSLIEKIPLWDGRRIIAIMGAPASGKSTLAKLLCANIPNACVLPMDGFHLSNEELERVDLLSRKGAPETFDVAGFIEIIRSCRKDPIVPFPTFDRTKDCAVPAGGCVTAKDQTVLVEGNYLLLDRPLWKGLASEWDLSIKLDVPFSILRQRLVERWLKHGHDLDSAIARAERNDLPNAELIDKNSLKADYTFRSS